jgi:4-hydroxybenzoate polyprenyltransferase
MMGTLRAYVELARLSNAPTCATNVLVGAAAAAAATGRTLDWTAAALTSIGVVLLYVAGMALNDLVDVDLDRRERPRRPLPSGRVSMSGARRFVAATLALGWGLLAVQGWGPLWFATVLVVAIVLYDLLHRAGAAAVILMGLCRGLVYPVAFTAALTADGGSPDWTVVAWPAAAMTAYIVALSVVARREMAPSPGRRLWPTLVLPLIVLAPAAVLPARRRRRARLARGHLPRRCAVAHAAGPADCGDRGRGVLRADRRRPPPHRRDVERFSAPPAGSRR